MIDLYQKMLKTSFCFSRSFEDQTYKENLEKCEKWFKEFLEYNDKKIKKLKLTEKTLLEFILVLLVLLRKHLKIDTFEC